MGSDMGMGTGMGSGMMGGGMGYTNAYANGMGGKCCPMKKIWGSMNPKMDGMYVNVGKKSWGQLPGRCNSQCVYERKGAYDGLQYCFADSMYSQAECYADMEDGEEPVDMGPGDGAGEGSWDMGSGDMSGSGLWGMGSEDPVDMGSGPGSENPVEMGSGSGSEDPVDMGSGAGSEGPVDMGSGSENMGSGSGSGSQSSFCAAKVLMDVCFVDCEGYKLDPDNSQQDFQADSVGTYWKIFDNNPAKKITLTCPQWSEPQVTECKNGKETSEVKTLTRISPNICFENY